MDMYSYIIGTFLDVPANVLTNVGGSVSDSKGKREYRIDICHCAALSHRIQKLQLNSQPLKRSSPSRAGKRGCYNKKTCNLQLSCECTPVLINTHIRAPCPHNAVIYLKTIYTRCLKPAAIVHGHAMRRRVLRQSAQC